VPTGLLLVYSFNKNPQLQGYCRGGAATVGYFILIADLETWMGGFELLIHFLGLISADYLMKEEKSIIKNKEAQPETYFAISFTYAGRFHFRDTRDCVTNK